MKNLNKNILLLALISASLCACNPKSNFMSPDNNGLSSLELSNFTSVKRTPVIHDDFFPGETLSIHSDLQDSYLNDTYGSILNYARGTKDLYKGSPINLDYSNFDNLPASGVFTIKVAENSDLTDALTFTTTSTKFSLYNSKLNTTYYWQVTNDSFESDIYKFSTADGIIRNLYTSGLTNCRDLGNYKSELGGVIKQGLLYRTAAFGFADPSGKSEITQETAELAKNVMKLKTDIDLANRGERLTNVSYKKFTMYYNDSDLTENVDGVNVVKSIIDAKKNKESIKSVFETLANADNYPIAFHCDRGRDRTGAIAYLVETLLGVDLSDSKRDYYFTNFSNDNACYGNQSVILKYERVINKFEGSTRAEKCYKFLTDFIGVSSENLDNIRSILLS